VDGAYSALNQVICVQFYLCASLCAFILVTSFQRRIRPVKWRMTSIFLNLLLKNVPYIYLVVSSSDTLVVINQMFYLADTGD